MASFSVREALVTEDHARAEELHTPDVRRLPANVFFAHEHFTRQPEERAGRGGGDAVLPGPRLGDDSRLPHLPGEEDLPERVVDLVRAGVTEVLPLQEQPREVFPLGVDGAREPRGVRDGRGAPDVRRQEVSTPSR